MKLKVEQKCLSTVGKWSIASRSPDQGLDLQGPACNECNFKQWDFEAAHISGISWHFVTQFEGPR